MMNRVAMRQGETLTSQLYTLTALLRVTGGSVSERSSKINEL